MTSFAEKNKQTNKKTPTKAKPPSPSLKPPSDKDALTLPTPTVFYSADMLTTAETEHPSFREKTGQHEESNTMDESLRYHLNRYDYVIMKPNSMKAKDKVHRYIWKEPSARMALPGGQPEYYDNLGSEGSMTSPPMGSGNIWSILTMLRLRHDLMKRLSQAQIVVSRYETTTKSMLHVKEGSSRVTNDNTTDQNTHHYIESSSNEDSASHVSEKPAGNNQTDKPDEGNMGKNTRQIPTTTAPLKETNTIIQMSSNQTGMSDQQFFLYVANQRNNSQIHTESQNHTNTNNDNKEGYISASLQEKNSNKSNKTLPEVKITTLPPTEGYEHAEVAEGYNNEEAVEGYSIEELTSESHDGKEIQSTLQSNDSKQAASTPGPVQRALPTIRSSWMIATEAPPHVEHFPWPGKALLVISNTSFP